jgi:hypothetical protein
LQILKAVIHGGKAVTTSRPARRLSRHREAVKALRWRARKVAERRGAMLVALLV